MRGRIGTVAVLVSLAVALVIVVVPPLSGGPDRASAAAPAASLCLPDVRPASLDTLFDVEPGGVIGADYPRALTMPDGRVLWTFQDAAVRVGPDDIRIVHNIAMIQDGACFDVLYGGTAGAPRSYLFDDRTTRFERWFWPLDATAGDDGRIYVYAAEMDERGDAYLTTVVPVGTWVAVFDPATDTVVEELRPVDSSADLYGWSITSDDRWTYLYAQCHRQFGFDDYAFVDAFDRSCSTDVTVARVPRGKVFDPYEYWDGASWQSDPARARSIIDADGRRINADQFEWTGQRFVSVNKEGDWWGDTILLSESTSPTGPFRVYDEIGAPVKCSDCNSFFATWIPAAAARRTGDAFVIALSHNRWDGVVSSYYRPTFHHVAAPAHVPTGATVEVRLPVGTSTAALNVAAVDPHAPGYLTVHPCDEGLPLASNVNHVDARVVSNLVLARPDEAGRVCVFSLAETNLVVDVSGSFDGVASFDPVAQPLRIADTRSGIGVPDRRVRAGEVLRVPVPGGAAAGAAVALNVIAVDPAADSHLTVYPCDRALPATSNVNSVGQPVVSNLVVVPTDQRGDVCVYTHAETDVVADLAGTFAADGYVPLDDAQRLVDTREQAGDRVSAGGTLEVDVPEGSGVALLNIIAVDPAAPGFVTVHPCDRPLPLASNINYGHSRIVSNLVIAQPSDDGRVCVFTSAETDIVVDLAGSLPDTSDYVALDSPSRLLDTRIGTGVPGQFGVR